VPPATQDTDSPFAEDDEDDADTDDEDAGDEDNDDEALFRRSCLVVCPFSVVVREPTIRLFGASPMYTTMRAGLFDGVTSRGTSATGSLPDPPSKALVKCLSLAFFFVDDRPPVDKMRSFAKSVRCKAAGMLWDA
jgi:hypothetical protein